MSIYDIVYIIGGYIVASLVWFLCTLPWRRKTEQNLFFTLTDWVWFPGWVVWAGVYLALIQICHAWLWCTDTIKYYLFGK